ncbi:MAG: histidine phosphatase family protein [Proteobacteria bacterium]|nr:histidine phosphatase family protein [Pseudomonadota bacterium]
MILLRHGQSEFNVVFGQTRKDPGIKDPPLTVEGERQARAAAEALAGRRIDVLVASPYTRALQTADILRRALALEVRIEPLVRERAAFTCDIGTPASELGRLWPVFDFSHLDETWWSEEEETPELLLGRCRRFAAHAAALEHWHRLLIVTHWGFIRGLTGRRVANGELVPYDPTVGVVVPAPDPW